MTWKFIPENRLWPRVEKGASNECWPWTGSLTQAGYGLLTIQYKSYYAHRLAWELHHNEEIPEGGVICHHCDNPACCNPNHLFLGTQDDNMKDAANKKRIKHGENHHSASLTEDDIRQIRKFGEGSDLTRQQIASRFGIVRTTVNDILTGRTWQHVDPDWNPPKSKSRGTKHPNAKLTEDDVREIRRLSANGLSQRKLAAQFGVSRGTIEPILKGETWKHVT